MTTTPPNICTSTSWQALKQNSHQKASLIQPELEATLSLNILDIGCNAGQVTRLLSPGRFALGLDACLDTRGFNKPYQMIALGQMRIDLALLDKIPQFDSVLLLSVHHQFYASLATRDADLLFAKIAAKAQKIFIIEFAAIRSKYGWSGNEFIDNDTKSVKSFAEGFLAAELPRCFSSVKFLGTTPEKEGIELLRYMYAAYRSTFSSV